MEIRKAELLTAGAVGLVVVSLLLPWVTADGPVIVVDGSLQETQTGLESGDGILAIGATVLAGIVAWLRNWDLLTVAVVGLVGLFVAGISALYLSDPAFGAEPQGLTTESDLNRLVEPGVGLFFSLAGGALLLLATYSGYRRPTGSDAGMPRDDRSRRPETSPRPGQRPRRRDQDHTPETRSRSEREPPRDERPGDSREASAARSERGGTSDSRKRGDG